MSKVNQNIKGFDDYDVNEGDKNNLYHGSIKFTRKHVYSVKNNPMCGITFYQYLQILIKYGQFIELSYFPRAIFILLVSIFNSLLSMIESIIYTDYIIQSIRLPDNPVFIIGHPRTGTTLLHNIMASDNQSFYYCSTFCAGFPTCFLWFENLGKYLFAHVIEKTRPMDSMPLHFDLPQEDECACNVLSHGRSYYMPLWFMCQEPMFRKYLDFSVVDGGNKEDEEEWSKAFLYLLKKLTLREYKRHDSTFSYFNMNNYINNRNRSPDLNTNNFNNNSDINTEFNKRLLLKSPIHAARVPLLKKLFPQAKFIYLHRNPYEVFQSEAHMVNTAYWFCYFNTPTTPQIVEFIFWQFEHMWIKYRDAKKMYGDDILEVSYKELVGSTTSSDASNSINTDDNNVLKKIYEFCDVHYSDYQTQLFASQTGTALAGYQVNKHIELPVSIKQMISERWREYIDTYGYDK